VRVIGVDGKQVGVLPLHEAINMARTHGVDLVEIAATATPPVCRLVDYGKFRYEQSKKDKDAKKHQHSNRVKEVQLSPNIDPHDFSVKLTHAIEFLCEDSKVKISLRFRGREMAHKEFGFQVVERFIKSVAPYAQPDSPPKLIGRGLNVMLSPLPRNKRARPPGETPAQAAAADARAEARDAAASAEAAVAAAAITGNSRPVRAIPSPAPSPAPDAPVAASGPEFVNNPFAQLKASGDQ
jgi:translation initiation factor IF-3